MSFLAALDTRTASHLSGKSHLPEVVSPPVENIHSNGAVDAGVHSTDACSSNPFQNDPLTWLSSRIESDQGREFCNQLVNYWIQAQNNKCIPPSIQDSTNVGSTEEVA